jgi:hypothetical protein
MVVVVEEVREEEGLICYESGGHSCHRPHTRATNDAHIQTIDAHIQTNDAHIPTLIVHSHLYSKSTITLLRTG